jgi:23S rRNA pseudouridine955/2504/2580 synthase
MLIEVTVNLNDAGQRAERYLRKFFPFMTLDRLQSLFRRKEIKIARKPIQRNYSLEAGDFIQVYGVREEDLKAPAEVESLDNDIVSDQGHALPGIPQPSIAKRSTRVKAKAPAWIHTFGIPILHEDREILVLDKPAGMAVHPGTGIATGDSLIEKVWVYLAPEREPGELFQPSLVHRLDKDTSGVLVVAKTGGCLRRLNAAMREGAFTKRYLALVEGIPNPVTGEISGLLHRVDSRGGGAKSKVTEDDGKWSVTKYKTVKDFGNFSLLSVIIETGRMHQIRAHLAHMGHPVAGDPRYGDFEKNRVHRKAFGIKRTFLHAADLDLDLGKGGKLSFHAPLPKDLSSVIERLKNQSPEIQSLS